MKFFYFLLSILIWLFVLVTVPLMFLLVASVWLLTFWWDKRLYFMNICNSIWGSMYIWINPLWRVSVRNLKAYRRRKSTIIVANHQSVLDIFVMYKMFPVARWISKSENFKIPFIGWAMRLARAIEIKRGSRVSTRALFEKAGEALQSNCSILIFAEGTRSKDDDLRPFKPGAFDMAIQNKRPIQPVVLYGTGKALPKHGYIMKKGQKMILEVLDEIPYEAFKDMDTHELAKMVHEKMRAKYIELRDEINR